MKRKARKDLRTLRIRHDMVQPIRARENVQRLRPAEDSGHEMAKLLALRDCGEAIREWWDRDD